MTENDFAVLKLCVVCSGQKISRVKKKGRVDTWTGVDWLMRACDIRVDMGCIRNETLHKGLKGARDPCPVVSYMLIT